MSETAPNLADEISVRELTHHTSRVLARVKAGETLTVTERGEPIATVVPRRQSRVRRPAVGYASSGDPDWAKRSDEELTGFGE